MITYDLLVIGSGAAAFGIIKGVPKNLKVGIISPVENQKPNLIRDSQGDIVSVNSFGGGLNLWHGISSFELFININQKMTSECLDFFMDIYDEPHTIAEYLLRNTIYIPRKKITKKHLEDLLKNKSIIYIDDEAINLIENDKGVLIFCRYATYQANKVIVCAGAFGSAELLKRSNLCDVNLQIGNHLNGYCKLNENRKLNSTKVIIGKNGHIKHVEYGTFLTSKYIVMPRPAFFDFRNKTNLIKHKSIYSRETSEIYKKILQSFSPGLVIESLYNRYGKWLLTNRCNYYFQIETEGIYRYVDSDVQIDQEKLEKLIFKLKKNEFEGVIEETLVSGIHFYNTVKPKSQIGTTLTNNPTSLQKKILVADSSTLSSIGGSHHTFSIMALNYFAMKIIYN